MLQRRYSVRLPLFLGLFAIWSLWTVVWVLARPEALIWGPIKWIMVALFSPIGVVLLGSLTGYRIDFDGRVLRVGFFPFVRKLPWSCIADLRLGGFAMSIWHTDEVLRIVTRKGEVVGIPCDDAREISRLLERHLPEDEGDE
ncbi:MAG TPA: hypothetical protein G4O08_02030 [Anaerolineae bacterium]|nr:hypothetical protein [Anaerolineae bacterium]